MPKPPIHVAALLVLLGAAVGALVAIAAVGHRPPGSMQRPPEADEEIVYQQLQRELGEEFESRRFDEIIVHPEANQVDENIAEPFRTHWYYDEYGNHQRVDATMNTAGFRGRQHQREKPQGTVRVVAIGDSHTFGSGLQDGETFCAQLEWQLNSANAPRHFEVLNMGYPALNLWEKLEVLRSRAMPYDPDVVILQYDGDDLFPKPYRKWEQATALKLSRRHNLSGPTVQPEMGHLCLLIRLKLVTRLTVGFLEQTMIREPLEQFIETCRGSHAAVVVIGTWPTREESIVKTITRVQHIPYLNVTQEVFRGQNYSISRYEPHFNRDGHRLIAEALSSVILQRNGRSVGD